MGDSLPRTSMNHRAKFDAARFISGGEIRNRTNKQKTTQTVNDISTLCLSACVHNEWKQVGATWLILSVSIMGNNYFSCKRNGACIFISSWINIIGDYSRLTTVITVTTVTKVCLKTIHLIFDHNCGTCRLIYKILSLSDSWGNAVHINYQDFPPHFQWRIACETSEFILQDMMPPYSFRSESYDYTIWKIIQQCSEEDPRYQRTKAVDDWRVRWAAADSHWRSSHQWIA